MHKWRKRISYHLMPLWWPRSLLKGSDCDQFLLFFRGGGGGGENGKNRRKYLEGVNTLSRFISSMHRWRKMICYIIILLGVA